jgi:hypothetical protein
MIGDKSLDFFSNRQAIQTQMPQIATRFKGGELTDPVAWIKFRDQQTPAFSQLTFDIEYATRRENPQDYTDVTADYEERINSKDRLPVFYLPWASDYFVRMTIPEYRIENVVDFGSGVEIDPYCPRLFFTAALSGCPVSVYGDPRRPTVVHVGTERSTPYGEDCARFWRELLWIERLQRRDYRATAHEVNVNDYMGNTETLQKFKEWLKTQRSKFNVEHVVNWGAVFGIRYGRLWSFYLQENAIVERFTVEKEKRLQQRTKTTFGLFPRTQDEWADVDVKRQSDTQVPVSVRPFFPKGDGYARLWDRFSESYR